MGKLKRTEPAYPSTTTALAEKSRKNAKALHSMIIGIIATVIVTAIIVVSLILVLSPKENKDVMEARALKESQLQTRGSWYHLENERLEIMLPKRLDSFDPQETKDLETVPNAKVTFTADNSRLVTQSIGVIIGDEDKDAGFNIKADPGTVIDHVRDSLNSAFLELFHAGTCSNSYDVDVVELEYGTDAVKLRGNAELLLKYQDPKKPDEPYEEKTAVEFLAYIIVINDRPITIFGTYDYSVPDAEDSTDKRARTTANSIIETPESTQFVKVTTLPGGARVGPSVPPEEPSVTPTAEPNATYAPAEPNATNAPAEPSTTDAPINTSIPTIPEPSVSTPK